MSQRSSAEIRASIEEQRELLAGDLVKLRNSLAEASDWRRHLRAHKTEAIAVAAVAGFVVAGGLSVLSGGFRRRRR